MDDYSEEQKLSIAQQQNIKVKQFALINIQIEGEDENQRIDIESKKFMQEIEVQ